MTQKVHFRLTSVAQKHCCLSSLFNMVKYSVSPCCGLRKYIEDISFMMYFYAHGT